MTDAIADVWRQIIIGDHKSWVLFADGTCVILMEPEDDLATQATTGLPEALAELVAVRDGERGQPHAWHTTGALNRRHQTRPTTFGPHGFEPGPIHH